MVINILCLILLIGVIIYLIVIWGSLPDKIPGHYNAMGEIDKWSNKGSLFAVPIVAWIMFIGISVLEGFPQVWNTGVAVTVENQVRVYRNLRNMISTLKFLIVVNFVYLTINSSRATSLTVWFLPVFLILIFGSMIFFIIKLVRER